MIESVLVGIYCILVYFSLYSYKINSLVILLLLAGFIKHFFGYVLGIQKYYCNCIYFNQPWMILFIECIIESLLFVFIGLIFSQIIKNRILLFFLIGVSLHSLFELAGFHSFFCMNKCVDPSVLRPPSSVHPKYLN